MNIAQGINFVKVEPEKHIVGIKRAQFIEYLNSLDVDQNGWLNFTLTVLQQPIKGFSCKLSHMMPKDVYEAKKLLKEQELQSNKI